MRHVSLALYARRRVATGRRAWLIVLAVCLFVSIGHAAAQQRRMDPPENGAQVNDEFRRLFDAVVAATRHAFWNKERLQEVRWELRAEEARAGVVEAATLQEAARRINALLGLLRTSHTSLQTPEDVFYYLQKDVFWGKGSFDGIGTFSERIDDRDFIDAILEGSPAAQAGLKVGDELVAVDGAPYHPIQSFRAKSGLKAAVGVRRRRDGPVETIPIPVETISPLEAFGAATLASARVIERDGFSFGYVHIWASLGDSEKALVEALGRFGIGKWRGQSNRLTPLAVDGLIVDMRGKIGGYMTMAARYLEHIDPRGPDVVFSTAAEPRTWASVRGRTTVLIDHRTRSAAELFVHAYKRERQGPLIGTKTAGAVSGGSLQVMPLDCVLHLAVTGLSVDGEALEGRGVAPDIEVARTVPYANGADPVLDAAIDWLARNVALRDGPPRTPTGGN